MGREAVHLDTSCTQVFDSIHCQKGMKPALAEARYPAARLSASAIAGCAQWTAQGPGEYLHLPIVCSTGDEEIRLLAQRGGRQLVQRGVLGQKDAVCMACAVLWLCPACTCRSRINTLSPMMQMMSDGTAQSQAARVCVAAVAGIVPLTIWVGPSNVPLPVTNFQCRTAR